MDAKRRTLKVGSLRLDARNTRIPEERRSVDEKELIRVLVEHEDALGLARSIARRGLYPNERLVVIPDGDQSYTVVEGNRRLAAIKMLLDPAYAPDERTRRRIRSLAGTADLDALKKLDVVVFPDRMQAAPLVAALHTRAAKKRWERLQQARFYREMIAEGRAIGDVAAELGVSPSVVRGFLRAETLHRIARKLDLPPEVASEVDSPKFPLSTLARVLESAEGKRFLGVEYDEEHGLRGVVHPDRFRAVLAHVVRDIVTRERFTRDINTEAQLRDYISESEAALPTTKKRGSFAITDVLGEPQPLGDPTPEVKPKRPRAPRASSSIIPIGFPCTVEHDRIRRIFRELRSLDLVKHTNSSAVMLRVLMDIALWEFYKREGHVDAVVSHCDNTKARRRHRSDWTPTLTQLVSYAENNRLFPGFTRDEYKSTKLLVSGTGEAPLSSIDEFNQFTHNPFSMPTPEGLRAHWTRAEPMMRLILNP